MAVLVVEHDMNFVMGVCDDVIVLDFGRLIAHGSPDEVSTDPAVIAAYLGDGSEEPATAPAEATAGAAVAGGAA
jgi:ABC-type uncharacterized transport system ATPase subunit